MYSAESDSSGRAVVPLKGTGGSLESLGTGVATTVGNNGFSSTGTTFCAREVVGPHKPHPRHAKQLKSHEHERQPFNPLSTVVYVTTSFLETTGVATTGAGAELDGFDSPTLITMLSVPAAGLTGFTGLGFLFDTSQQSRQQKHTVLHNPLPPHAV